MTMIRDSLKMGETIAFTREIDGRDLEIYYDDAENTWYIATDDRDEFIKVGTDADLDELYNILKHIVENIPWEDQES